MFAHKNKKWLKTGNMSTEQNSKNQNLSKQSKQIGLNDCTQKLVVCTVTLQAHV